MSSHIVLCNTRNMKIISYLSCSPHKNVYAKDYNGWNFSRLVWQLKPNTTRVGLQWCLVPNATQKNLKFWSSTVEYLIKHIELVKVCKAFLSQIQCFPGNNSLFQVEHCCLKKKPLIKIFELPLNLLLDQVIMKHKI